MAFTVKTISDRWLGGRKTRRVELEALDVNDTQCNLTDAIDLAGVQSIAVCVRNTGLVDLARFGMSLNDKPLTTNSVGMNITTGIWEQSPGLSGGLPATEIGAAWLLKQPAPYVFFHANVVAGVTNLRVTMDLHY